MTQSSLKNQGLLRYALQCIQVGQITITYSKKPLYSVSSKSRPNSDLPHLVATQIIAECAFLGNIFTFISQPPCQFAGSISAICFAIFQYQYLVVGIHVGIQGSCCLSFFLNFNWNTLSGSFYFSTGSMQTVVIRGSHIQPESVFCSSGVPWVFGARGKK